MLPARSVKGPLLGHLCNSLRLMNYWTSYSSSRWLMVIPCLSSNCCINRAFTTPRSLLLGIQKRFWSLTRDVVDDIFLAKFAQMRIYALLGKWIANEPGDLATVGAEPAFAALLNNILQYTHLAHYASELFPFLDVVSQLTDVETAWALPESTRRYKGGDGEGSHEIEDESDEVNDSTDGCDHATLVSNGM